MKIKSSRNTEYTITLTEREAILLAALAGNTHPSRGKVDVNFSLNIWRNQLNDSDTHYRFKSHIPFKDATVAEMSELLTEFYKSILNKVEKNQQ